MVNKIIHVCTYRCQERHRVGPRGDAVLVDCSNANFMLHTTLHASYDLTQFVTDTCPFIARPDFALDAPRVRLCIKIITISFN